MTPYYICAWVLGSDIVLVGSRNAPFTHNEQPLIEADYRIVAEMSGEMKDAGELLPLLSLDGQALVGLDFISQSVEEV
jgi:hypothetical protein